MSESRENARQSEVAPRLAKIREINRQCLEGKISEAERMRLQELLVPGLFGKRRKAKAKTGEATEDFPEDED